MTARGIWRRVRFFLSIVWREAPPDGERLDIRTAWGVASRLHDGIESWRRGDYPPAPARADRMNWRPWRTS